MSIHYIYRRPSPSRILEKVFYFQYLEQQNIVEVFQFDFYSTASALYTRFNYIFLATDSGDSVDITAVFDIVD